MIAFAALLYYYVEPLRTLYLAIYGLCVLTFFSKRPSVSVVDIAILLFLIVKIIVETQQISLIATLLYIRLYWGFLLFYIYFKSSNFDLYPVACLFGAVNIIEYILVQFMPSFVVSFPNYMQPDVIYTYIQASGLLAGSYGFGGNRTVTATILLALFAYYRARPSSSKYLLLLGSICSFSGVALGLMFVYLFLLNARRIMTSKFGFLLTLITAVCFWVIVSGDEPMFYRFSLAYLTEVIIDYKAGQFEEALALIGVGGLSFYFGKHGFSSENSSAGDYGLYFGDFFMLEHFVQYGLIGVFLILFHTLRKAKGDTFFPIYILVLASFHYHVIFSVPGQMALGYLMSRVTHEHQSPSTFRLT